MSGQPQMEGSASTLPDFDVPSYTSGSGYLGASSSDGSNVANAAVGLSRVAAVVTARNDTTDKAKVVAADTSDSDFDPELLTSDPDTVSIMISQMEKKLRAARKAQGYISSASSVISRPVKKTKNENGHSSPEKVVVQGHVIAEPLDPIRSSRGALERGGEGSVFRKGSSSFGPVRGRPREVSRTSNPRSATRQKPETVPSFPCSFTPGGSKDPVSRTFERPIIVVDQDVNKDIQLKEYEQRLRSIEVKAEIEAASNEAREQEAWTAQQNVVQLETSAMLRSMEMKRTLNMVEDQAQTVVDGQRAQMNNVEQTANTVVSEQQRMINQLRENEVMMKAQAEAHLYSLTSRAESQHAQYEFHAAQMQRRLELMASELAMANRSAVANAAGNGEADRTTNPPKVANAACGGGVNGTGYTSPKSRSISSSVRHQDVSRLENMFERLMNRMDDDSRARENSQKDLANTLWSIEERLTFVETNPVLPTVEVANAAQTRGSPKRKDKTNLTSKDHVANAAQSKESKSGKDKTISKSEFEHHMQRGSASSSTHPSTFDRIYKSDDTRKTKSGGGNDPDPDDDESDEEDGNPDDKDRNTRKRRDDPDGDPDDDGDEDGDGDDDEDDRPHRTAGPSHDDRDEQAKKFMKSLFSSASRSKTKEADVIKLVSLPEPAQFRAWRHSTRSKVVAASNNPEAAFKWIKEVEEPSATIDSFRDSGKFLTLDSKLASALSDIAKGDLGRKITLLTEKEDREGRLTRGRQILRAIYDHFKLDEFAGVLYELTDLMAIKIKADSPSPKQLEWFMTSWESTLAGMKKEPTDDVLEALFIERVRGCPGIAQDIGVYDRARSGEAQRSYAFLYESVTRFLERRRRNENRKAIQTALANSTGGKSQPSAPAPGKNAKKRGKGGGKSRSGSQSSASRGASSSKSSGRYRIRTKSKDPTGVCYKWKNTGKCDGKDNGSCKYGHPADQKGTGSREGSPSKKGGKGKGRGKGGSGRSSSPSNKKKSTILCTFHLKGECTRGSNCRFVHKDESPAAPAKEQKKKNKGNKNKGSEKDFA